MNIKTINLTGAATPEEYAEELAHRRYWRSEINRLEG